MLQFKDHFMETDDPTKVYAYIYCLNKVAKKLKIHIQIISFVKNQ